MKRILYFSPNDNVNLFQKKKKIDLIVTFGSFELNPILIPSLYWKRTRNLYWKIQ